MYICERLAIKLVAKLLKMKITITLSDAQVKGITDYLKETDNDINPKIGKEQIAQYISGIVHSTLECDREAVSDYIKEYESA